MQDLSAIKLIVGLGNIGEEFAHTRHNAGFIFLDHLQANWPASNWREQPILKSQIATIKELDRPQVMLAKPQTMMNLSGTAVSAICKYYQIFANEVVVVHDDLDIPIGSYKIQFGKGPKMHNGLISIYKLLKTDQFWHLRIGIENRPVKGNKLISGQGYALGRFTPPEIETLQTTNQNIAKELLSSSNPRPNSQ